MPTECIQAELDVGRSRTRRLVGAFDGGAITSNGGVALLAGADRRLRLAERLATCFTDLRVARRSRTRCPIPCASASSVSRSATRT
ncbi:MAG: transposase [Hyphomicrobiaceae bacterium]|nr:transposase [Hyphomicrobiaceae bacterium]